MNSIWSKSVTLPQFNPIDGDKKTDVLIIGGGISGILCAYLLQEKGVDYMLVEGASICKGVTKNTTAKITSQHGLIYNKLLKSNGYEKAKMYLDANQAALKQYESLCGNIDCDFEIKPSYVYSLDDRRKLEKEAEALYKLGYTAKLTETNELPFRTVGAVCFEHQAQFNPLKLMAHISQGLNIYEHTFVKEFKENIAVTDRGNISFQRIIFATHFPIDNKYGMYFIKMYQHRSYVIAYENAANVEGMYIDESKKGLSFRNYGDYLLLGGGSHHTGKKGGNWQEIREYAKKYYPDAKEKYFWATQDCMTLDGIPYIGKYSKRLYDCYVATGFNKWGMTSSMVAARILSDMIVGKDNPYAPVFNPARGILKPQLFLNIGNATMNLLTISKKRCPHMGCALKWNETEHTWDCPCHGSRFDTNGKVLNNPSNGDIIK